MRPALPLLLALALAGMVWGPALHAAPEQDAEARYRAAAATFHALRAAPVATPAQWQALAEQFRGVHAAVPETRRGADALYSTALAYREAWRVSNDWHDLSRTAALLRDFVGRYRADRLADDALMHLAVLLANGFNDPASARDTYRRVMTDYADGDQQPVAKRRLEQVEQVLAEATAREAAAHKAALAGSPAPSAAQPRQAAQAAVEAKATGANGESVSTEATGATGATAAAQRELAALTTAQVHGQDARAAGTALGRVSRVQFWSAREWTRVILTMDPQVAYRVNQLAPERSSPQRIYFDLTAAQPGEALAALTAVDDGVLQRIRISRFTDTTTRVVLDLRRLERYEIKDFRLPNERKIVVDLHPPGAWLAARRRQAAPGTPAAPAVSTGPPVPTVPALAQQTQPASNRLLPEPSVRVPLALPVRSIVIDPGHGGHDPGAQGYGISEKDVALSISLRLREVFVRHHPDLRVGMTRETDAFIPLQERPQIAKRLGADLFVSVHLNANPIRRFHGVETYFLNLTDDHESLQVAARENATSAQRVNDLNDILLDLMRDTTLVESGELAKAVQGSLVESLRERHDSVRDLGVKQAPFLVLMGAEMPGALVEVGFLTNEHESRRLQDADYQQRIAEGIYEGLRRYIEQQNVIARGHTAGPLAANLR